MITIRRYGAINVNKCINIGARMGHKISEENLANKVMQIKERCLEICVKAGSGHVTSAFSCAEIVTVLYYKIMHIKVEDAKWMDRDRFIMSKNHASVITYPILEDMGFVKTGEIDSFLEDGSIYGAHSKLTINGVDFAGGSLGIGLGVACGMAYSAKTSGKKWLTFCIVGDGEIYEGSIWEAAMFAGANNLGNLIVFVDRNHMCVTDFTDNMLSQNPLEEKWMAFNWEVRKINGHSIHEVIECLSDIRNRKDQKPLCIIAETIKGKGIKFMENNPFMHGVAPQNEKAELAMQQLKGEE